MVNTVLLADGIYVAMGKLASLSGFALEDARGISPDRLTPTVAGLRTAAESAVEKDRRDSWNAWEELKSLFTHGIVGYLQERKEFERLGEAHITTFLQGVAAIEQTVVDVQTAIGTAPDDLEASSQEWATAAASVGGIRERITAVQHIPGWAGGSSSGYTRRSMVQDGATEELRGVATSMSNALTQIALFNRALVLYIDREIINATKKVNELQGSADGWFYRRSANGQWIVNTLDDAIQQARQGEPVQSMADTLQSLVSECLEAPQLLAPGAWPTGGGKAGLPPAPTDAVTHPDAEERIQDHDELHGVHQGGVQRNSAEDNG